MIISEVLQNFMLLVAPGVKLTEMRYGLSL
jgi:hypothetical protein